MKVKMTTKPLPLPLPPLLLLPLLLLAVFSSSIAFTKVVQANPTTDADADGCTVEVETVTLQDDPLSPGSSPAAVDFYKCAGSNSNNGNQAFIVLACGLGVSKANYTTFAEGLVRQNRNYQVAVVEHLVPSFRPPFTPINTVNALDVSNTLSKAEEMDGYDTSRIVLMGHSFGGGTALNAIEGECPFPFCIEIGPRGPTFQPVSVERHPNVVMGAAYGFSLNDRLGQCPDPFSRVRNVDGVPFKVINGAGDINFFNSLQCTNEDDGTLVEENLTTGSFDRLNPTKVFATIGNLDHYSISEEITNTRRGDTLSSLPRGQQIATVVDSMSFLLKQSLKKNPTRNFCNQLAGRGDEMGYDLVDCLEEYEYSP